MRSSKAFVLIESFSRAERKSFRYFVQSPYFNRNEAVTALYEWLLATPPAASDFTREQAWAHLFPGRLYEEKHINLLLSGLLKLAEQFAGLERILDDRRSLQVHSMQRLYDQNLHKHYQYLYDRAQEDARQQAIADAEHYFYLYRIENMEAERFSQLAPRKFNEAAQRAVDYLDHFYLAEKLRLSAYMLTMQMVIATPHNLQLTEEIGRYVGRHLAHIDSPLVRAYYYIVNMFSRDAAEGDFEALKILLHEQRAAFNEATLAELYQYAINYCNVQLLKMRTHYLGEALSLYIDGVDSGILLEKGRLSPWHFKNMVKLALRLERYAWAESFIVQKSALLDGLYREDALHYNLAELYYYTNRFDEAMQHLNKVEFTDISYNLGAKRMLCKIYYEQNALDALESLLHAHKTYLHRNKLISEDLRRAHLNFIRLLNKALRLTPGNSQALRQEIERVSPLTEKDWLLKITGVTSF